MEIRWAYTARKHRIGKARARHAMEHAYTVKVTTVASGDPGVRYMGQDDRGVELEVIAVDKSDHLLVIHVMPTQYRRN